MSYKCDQCNSLRIGKALNRVDEIRNVVYERIFTKINRKTKEKFQVLDKEFSGQEYVNIQKLCETCYNNLKDLPPKIAKGTKIVKFTGKRAKSNVIKTDDSGGKLDLSGLKKKFDNRKLDKKKEDK